MAAEWCTTRKTVIGGALSIVVHYEPYLKCYQQWFISSWPAQLRIVADNYLNYQQRFETGTIVDSWLNISSSSC
jgi:hypothetical protein